MFLKRMFYILLLPLFIVASMFADERILIDYKNMALEADSSPKWLEELFKNEKSDNFRKKFDVDSDDKIFYAKAESKNITMAEKEAKMYAMLDCKRKLVKEGNYKIDNFDTISLSGFIKVTDFWVREKDTSSEEIVSYYIVYKMSEMDWQKNKEILASISE